MSAELLEAYEMLPENEKKEVLDFIMFLRGRGRKSSSGVKSGKADSLMDAFDKATVNIQKI